MTKSEINKILKPKTTLLYVALALIVLSVVMYIVAAVVKPTKSDEEEAKNNAIDYRKLLFNYDNITGEYTKLDVTSVYSFAGKDNLTYYYAQDEDGYVYVIRITDETFEDMEREYNKSTNPDSFTYTIYGYVRDVYPDLKKFIISEFDDVFGSEYRLSSSDYDDYFQDTYIDETLVGKFILNNKTIAGKNTLNKFFIGAGVISDIVGFILLIIYLKSLSRSKKSLKDYSYDVLYSQLASSDTICYKKEGLYLTSQYAITTSNGLRILNYYDIKWLYNVKNSVNGVPTTITLSAAYSDRKIYTIACTAVKNENILIEMMARIHERNNSILVGYTQENIMAYKEFQKSR
ncbi:MAG: hypothetical protein HDT13_01305 [Butyrivibrio sp.]|nr:hypothetical protein [Butyrivibrio sp.]